MTFRRRIALDIGGVMIMGYESMKKEEIANLGQEMADIGIPARR